MLLTDGKIFVEDINALLDMLHMKYYNSSAQAGMFLNIFSMCAGLQST